jgi:cyclophilin family peptidyl-prolyl cis-trans isomerase/predicted small lipoprotein YifL
MQRYGKAIFTSLTIATLLAIAGCGNKGDSATPQASIGGTDADKTKLAGGSAANAAAQDTKHPVVILDTSMGSITIRLDAEKAPLTVDNFLSYVNAKHYDQTVFHQVFKGQGILGGGFAADAEMTEKPHRTSVRNEADNGRKNCRATIAMVRSVDVIDSATCQFLLNVADNAALDHKANTPEGYGYCVFGDVISGMEVVDQIAAAPVEDTPRFERKPLQTMLIKSIRRK